MQIPTVNCCKSVRQLKIFLFFVFRSPRLWAFIHIFISPRRAQSGEWQLDLLLYTCRASLFVYISFPHNALAARSCGLPFKWPHAPMKSAMQITLVNDCGDVSKISSGKMEMDFGPAWEISRWTPNWEKREKKKRKQTQDEQFELIENVLEIFRRNRIRKYLENNDRIGTHTRSD